MKLELNIDEKVKETLVVVSANKIDKEVQNLINYIEYSSEYLIANIKFIKNLDFSNTGTIVIKYKNSDISYVSRRMIKEFKLKLGI